jgi:hypothetical protein
MVAGAGAVVAHQMMARSHVLAPLIRPFLEGVREEVVKEEEGLKEEELKEVGLKEVGLKEEGLKEEGLKEVGVDVRIPKTLYAFL